MRFKVAFFIFSVLLLPLSLAPQFCVACHLDGCSANCLFGCNPEAGQWAQWEVEQVKGNGEWISEFKLEVTFLGETSSGLEKSLSLELFYADAERIEHLSEAASGDILETRIWIRGVPQAALPLSLGSHFFGLQNLAANVLGCSSYKDLALKKSVQRVRGPAGKMIDALLSEYSWEGNSGKSWLRLWRTGGTQLLFRLEVDGPGGHYRGRVVGFGTGKSSRVTETMTPAARN